MAWWNVDPLRIALLLQHTPITYHPPVGPDISFQLNYNHKDSAPSSVPFFSYLGPKWTINYSSYILSNGSSVIQYGPGGATLTYSNFNTIESQR
jgi:hypothetical protein